MQREDLEPGRVWLIHDFLTPEECSGLIRKSEELGYEPATVNDIRLEKVRSNDRVLHTDHALAADLFPRARPFLPERFHGLRLAGFNELFRFYRYAPGHGFWPHRDGMYERLEVWEESHLTLMVYLSGGVGGGETVFFSKMETARRREPYLAVRPEVGLALVFVHDIWHAGEVVREGRKYVLRTDVMFAGPPEPGS